MDGCDEVGRWSVCKFGCTRFSVECLGHLDLGVFELKYLTTVKKMSYIGCVYIYIYIYLLIYLFYTAISSL